MKKIILTVVVFLICATSFAQILKPVKWSYASKRINDNEAIVFIKATMEKGWHIYSQTVRDGGPECSIYICSAGLEQNNPWTLRSAARRDTRC